jgi:hypothetical protein
MAWHGAGARRVPNRTRRCRAPLHDQSVRSRRCPQRYATCITCNTACNMQHAAYNTCNMQHGDPPPRPLLATTAAGIGCSRIIRRAAGRAYEYFRCVASSAREGWTTKLRSGGCRAAAAVCCRQRRRLRGRYMLTAASLAARARLLTAANRFGFRFSACERFALSVIDNLLLVHNTDGDAPVLRHSPPPPPAFPSNTSGTTGPLRSEECAALRSEPQSTALSLARKRHPARPRPVAARGWVSALCCFVCSRRRSQDHDDLRRAHPVRVPDRGASASRRSAPPCLARRAARRLWRPFVRRMPERVSTRLVGRGRSLLAKPSGGASCCLLPRCRDERTPTAPRRAAPRRPLYCGAL